MKTGKIFYTILNTRIGRLGIIWRKERSVIKILEIILPRLLIYSIRKDYSGILPGKNKIVEKIAKKIKTYIGGKELRFNLKYLDLSRLGRFQRKVLMLVYKIPKGKVKTYGEIARQLRIPKGARAVGQALAKNPFPIIIPCHRVIKSDGSLGGFKGNPELKKKLLESEMLDISVILQ